MAKSVRRITKVTDLPVATLRSCVTVDPDIRHPLYWNRVKLGVLLLGGVVALPLFILGVLVHLVRTIHDKQAS